MSIDYSRFKFGKGVPAVVKRQERKDDDQDRQASARAEVWKRDQGRDRATGQPLSKTDLDPDCRGECAHLRGRRVMPEWKYDSCRQVLLSVANHRLMHAGLLKVIGTDARHPLTFVRVNLKGAELWRRTR